MKIERTIVFTEENSTQLRVWVKVNDQATRLFIDSDCIENYMFSEFAQKISAQLQNKKESYFLQNFDELIMKYHNELVNQKIRLIHLRLKRHWKKLRLNITELSDSDIVLSISWFRSINSMIN